jgi:hypothetical protein
VPNVELGHHGDRCSFDAFIEKYQLIDPALNKLALIVRAADCGQPAGEGGGRPAGHLEGLSLNFADDHEMLKAGMVMYDALYAWCAPEEDRAARAEVMLLPGRARRACCRRPALRAFTDGYVAILLPVYLLAWGWARGKSD